jgi:PAS domain-containing protein
MDDEKNIEKPLDNLPGEMDAENWGGMIINTTLDSFWRTDSKGIFLYVNNAFCKLVGYGRDELLKLSLYDIDESKTFEETIIKSGALESCLECTGRHVGERDIND